ncbi:cytochrome b561 [Biostraticola tofi]|uniref:Cytochrome b561 n=1 Tax=Biostraticola tofi TaxID=466109 RepID=A0A4R3Z1P6_9GAMM|nr:cytochrome b561 [Biostraticola tofi]TCV99671.1 cytochrome b561 [Biostraticola tofi]
MKDKYGASQIALHWLTALLLVVAYSAIELRGFAQRGSWQGYALIIAHFSAGASVLVVMLLRLYLRIRSTIPAITPSLPRWQTGLSHLVHSAIYVLFICLPLLGMLSRYLLGRDWWLFGLTMPVADRPDPALAKMLTEWHVTLAPLGYWLVGLHALAALLHHYLLKDNTLIRMMPSRRIR